MVAGGPERLRNGARVLDVDAEIDTAPVGPLERCLWVEPVVRVDLLKHEVDPSPRVR